MLPCKHDTFLRRTNKKQLTHLESTAFLDVCIPIAYFAFAVVLILTFKVWLSLYGRKSMYKNPITIRIATTTPIPNPPPVARVPN